MRIRSRWLPLLLMAGTAACRAAPEAAPEALRISARDALLEAATVARAWSEGATLRYAEGEGVTAEGYVPPGKGFWRFVYDAPGRAEQLAVTVTPRALEQVTRPPQSPPGFVIGGAALGTDWVDSPRVLEAVRAAAGDVVAREGAAISALLVPLSPPVWLVRAAVGGEVREWRVNARTGVVQP